MRKQIILLLVLSLCFQGVLFAEEKVSAEDRIIGSAFKALAKGFVAITDINKLKKDNVDKLNKMSREKFRERYSAVYKTIKDLPVKLKDSYAVTEDMPKEQAVKDIESLNKEKIYEMIDSIPDKIIATQFKQYLGERKQAIQKSNVVQQVTKFWDRMISGARTAS